MKLLNDAKLTKRNFIKLAGIVGLTAAISGCGIETKLLTKKWRAFAEEAEEKVEYVPTICGMCPAACSVIARVRNGNVLQHQQL